MLEEVLPTILSTFPKIQVSFMQHIDHIFEEVYRIELVKGLLRIHWCVWGKIPLQWGTVSSFTRTTKPLNKRTVTFTQDYRTFTVSSRIFSTLGEDGLKKSKLYIIYTHTYIHIIIFLYNFSSPQEFQKRMKAIPAISKFLQPGSQRKSPPDEVYIKTVMNVLSHLFKQKTEGTSSTL